MNIFLILIVCSVVVLCGVFVWLNFRRVRRERIFLASDRVARRAAARKAGAHTLIWFRRLIMEHKYAKRSLRRRLDQLKIQHPKPMGTRNPKKLRKRIRILNRIVQAMAEKQYAATQAKETENKPA